MKELHISGVSERDTDLLLLEEFVSSLDFCELFLKTVGGGDFQQLLDATRSVTSSNGESDLEVIVRTKDNKRILILIENKVNASFQPKQSERYQKRGEAYIRNSRADSFCTVLIAPKTYFANDRKGFDYRINYEDLVDFFSNSALNAGRKFYKTELLSAAIEKSSSGYQSQADFVVSKFWKDYWHLASVVAPELRLEEPPNKPSGAGFIYFYQAGLPGEVVLVHKLGGHFDLQFAKMGKRLDRMRQVLEDRVDSDMKIVKASGSASIRLLVPILSTADPLAEQKVAAIQGLEAGRRLFEWARVNLDQRTLESLRE